MRNALGFGWILFAGLSAAAANTARRKAMTRIEQETREKTGLDCQIVTLYHGARYHLYSYKRYADIRLVMAPEKSVAFFGGDRDNFEYPRYDLDLCFFRIYEDDQPLKCEPSLEQSKRGPSTSLPTGLCTPSDVGLSVACAKSPPRYRGCIHRCRRAPVRSLA